MSIFSTSLRQTLEQIAQIEEEHNFLGVSVNLRGAYRQPGNAPTTEDLAEHVLDTLRETVELKKQVDSMPFTPPMPPERDTPSPFGESGLPKLANKADE